MKKYKIIVKEVFEIEAKSPKEAKEIWSNQGGKFSGKFLEKTIKSKPKLIK